MADGGRSAIRAARRSDLQRVADLRMRSLGEAAHAEPRLRLQPDARARTEQALSVWMGQDERILIVAEGPAPEGEVDGEPTAPPILGYAMGRMNVAPPVFQSQHVGELLEIFLLPEARGQGLGEALVQVITEALRGRGAQVLRAAVPVANTVARDQLQHAGYRPLQRILERQLDAG
jgi:ribosomal protein S18 acetylase RimI-like enzyme